jgi:flagellar biosynthesis protein FliQ
MPPDRYITLARSTFEITLWMTAPILIVTVIVGLVVSVIQTMTSIQEMSISIVARLMSAGAVAFMMMPWFLKKIEYFTLQLLSDFHPYVR